jgi:Kef-type K+ transport system membrane component KefB
VDQTIEVLALIGLADLLFLAGLETTSALAAVAGYVRTVRSSLQVSVGEADRHHRRPLASAG